MQASLTKPLEYGIATDLHTTKAISPGEMQPPTQPMLHMQQEDLCECITSKPRLIKSIDPAASIDLLGGEMLFLPLL